MAKLKSIRLAGWKSIEDMDPPLELGRINVLIGANGVGKSNLVSFIKLLQALALNNLRYHVGKAGGPDSLLHFGSKSTASLEACLVFEDDGIRKAYSLELAPAEVDWLFFSSETLTIGDAPEAKPVLLGQGQPESLLHREGIRGDQNATRMLSLIRQCRAYHFHDTSETAGIRKPVYLENNGFLGSDAGNLAAMLYLYQHDYPKAYRRIASTIRKITQGFDDFVLEPQRLNPKNLLLNWRQVGNDYLFGPHQLSDGTLRAMALITLLLQPEEDLPLLMVIDEPELGLHPFALELIAGLIKAVSLKTQVLVATQSPTFLEHFDPTDVIVVEARNGGSQFQRLKAEELKVWLDDYTIGELWQRNVIGGGPLS